MLWGPSTLDDAGAIRIDEERALLQTVDFFPPIVDNPFDYGRIAAANALSDIYAMGGEPLSVLNLAGFPRRELDLAILTEILNGGSAAIEEAGAALLGGHTVEDAEIKYGLAVTGIVAIDQLTTNQGAQPGDRILLTKPLGTGAVTTSLQQGRSDPEQVKAAVLSMQTLNRGAARAIKAVTSSAVTDVTGFGLLGHASEIARAADVTLTFEATALPLLPGAVELATDGCLSGGAGRSRRFLAERLEIEEGVDEALANLALDAETSGGLLICVPEKQVDDLVAALDREKTTVQAIVGRVEPRRTGTWVRLVSELAHYDTKREK